jgi:hypothetical protein
MKHSPLTRLLPWLLIAVCPPFLGRCGGAVEHGTETGNPPVVEQQKLHVLLRDTGVEVVGDVGAVSPGARVRVTNRTTGESAEATARADGSVSIVVQGSVQDEYEVTVSNGSGSQTVQVRAQTSGGMADAGSGPDTDMADPGGGPPSDCAALQETLAARVSAGFANVDKTCQRDEDCLFISTTIACYSSCPSVIASRSGAQAASAAVAPDLAPLCNEFDSKHCETPSLACVSGSPTLVCNGTCTEVDRLSCDDLSARTAGRLATVLNDAARTCSQDSDCALAQTDIRCVPSCGNFEGVASSALQGLQRSIAETEGFYCGQQESRGCPGPVELPCTPPVGTPQATCYAGQCKVTYAPGP